LAAGQIVSSSRITPRAMWVSRGDWLPNIPCTASFPTARKRFSGKRLKTGCKN